MEEERGALFSHMYYDQFFFRYIGKWAQGQSMNESFCISQHNQNITDKPCVWNLIQAMVEAHEYLSKLLGPDMGQWKWSAVHHRDYSHAPFSSNSVLKHFYHRSRPSGGNRRTVNVAVYYPQNHDFRSSTSANLRMIVSLDPKDQDYFIIDTGNFESPLSGHYDDQMDRIMNGEYLDMSFTREEQLSNMKHKLTLEFIDPLINLKATEL
jgi:acyl-homoserine lactone acylase PvdQ